MIEPPHAVETPTEHYAALRLLIPASAIQNEMGPGLLEVQAALAGQGVRATGPWFTHHFRRPTDTFDFEICVPVNASIVPSRRVQPGSRPATTVLRTVYYGGYEGLGAAWGEFHSWIAANGYTPATDFWEIYLTGPESSPDPATWRTQLETALNT